MEAFSHKICVRTMPVTDAEMMLATQEAWPLALAAMRQGAGAPVDDVRRLFDGLCRWRVHRTRWVPQGARARHRASCHYLIEAAARLTLMDWVHTNDGGALVRDICASSLSEAEEATARDAFDAIPLSDLTARLRAVTAAWRTPGSAERERAVLAPAAHALLVNEGGGMSTESAVVALDVAERTSTLCAARELLRAWVAAAEEDAPALTTAVAAWARARAAGAQSESAAKAHADAIAADWLDPSMLPAEEARVAVSACGTRTPVAVLLTLQEADTATRAAEASKTNVAALPSAAGRDEAVLVFSLFNHAARQLHGVAWAESYTATDARPEAAVARVRRYAAEKMINPPPLLLVVDQAVYALRRREGGDGIGRVTRYATGAAALAAWVETATAHPGVAPRYRGLMRQVAQAGDAPGDGGGIVLPLVPVEL